MRSIGLEHEEVVVCQRHLRNSFCRLSMIHRRVGKPCLASVFEMSFHATPFVPGQEAVEADQNQGEDDEENRANFGSLDQIVADVINNRHINIVAKGETILCWNWHDGGVERDPGKGVVDIFFEELERRVDTI